MAEPAEAAGLGIRIEGLRKRYGQGDTAVDALKETLRTKSATPAEIDRMARVDRVQAIVRPYLEALA